MLDLDAGVHFHEVEMVVLIQQELDGARVLVIHGARGFSREFADVFALRLGDLRRGRDLDQFLVAALNGTVALEQVDHVAVAVAQHLYFDMARVDHAPFHEDFRLAKSLAGLGNHALVVGDEVFFVVAAADAAPAAAVGGLEHHRVADLAGQHAGFFHVGEIALAARHAGNAGGDHGVARPHLVAHLADHFGIWPDEPDVAARADFGKLRVFREEAVARMQGVAAGSDGDVDDVMCIQIAGDRLGADVIGFVRFFYVQRVAVGIGVDGDRLDAHFRAGTHDADGNFTTVGDEYFFNHEYPEPSCNDNRAAY